MASVSKPEMYARLIATCQTCGFHTRLRSPLKMEPVYLEAPCLAEAVEEATRMTEENGMGRFYSRFEFCGKAIDHFHAVGSKLRH